MQKILFILISLLMCITKSDAQQMDSVSNSFDTATLQNVTVTAFATQAKWRDVPAAIAVISHRDFQLLNKVSLVPVLNTVPGVRMEERSPGSYRFSIRGSLLRSPFGVRNVKVYWNDISLTDAGGNTYLNVVDINQLQSIEVIKGPASSMYGANTGGALILHSGGSDGTKNSFNVALSGGSFGLFNEQFGWKYHSAKFSSNIQQSHQQSDGYRQQSSMRRDAVKWDGKWQVSNKETLSFLAFYSDLFYETPGGITEKQMDSIPTLARIATGATPGAVEQKTAVYNKTALAGISLSSAFNKNFENLTTLISSHTNFKNPFITNYEKRSEFNYGVRTTFTYSIPKPQYQFKWVIGGEWLQGAYNIDNYENMGGAAGAILFKDKVFSTQSYAFTQLQLELKKLTLQTGISYNNQLYKYKSLINLPDKDYTKKDAGKVWTPRFSMLYKITDNVAVYGIAAKGFSPPTLAEVRPSTGMFYQGLGPEFGWNYEAGIKGSILNNKLVFDVSYYYFNLKDAIVRRSDSTGAEYFVNAGGTIQKGIEFFIKAFLVSKTTSFVSSLVVTNSLSYQPYRFSSYVNSGNDYSGNKLTGVPRLINVNTIELRTSPGYYINFIYNQTSSIPLNDANSAFAERYHLLQGKIGYQKTSGNFSYNLYAGGDNLFNQLYSLGNDINAFGGRYFNPAPKRNYFIGVEIAF